MRPKSLSSTAIQTANLCMARYAAERLHYAGRPGNTYATLGSAVHGALETYVKTAVGVDGAPPTMPATLAYLTECFQMSYVVQYGNSDFTTEDYFDGIELIKKWHKRTSFTEGQVRSVEIKSTFDLPTSVGPIRFSYIWDRFDQLGPRSFKVVDYKTNRRTITFENLKQKIQPRVYALAAAIQLKSAGIDYDEIWVEFDMLRYERVGRVFTREENLATWEFLIREAERIIAVDDSKPLPETVNMECGFCVRKANCDALKRNVTVGGILGLDFDTAINRRAEVQWQASALKRLIDELDEYIEKQCEVQDLMEYTTDLVSLGFSSRPTRKVDPERVAQVVGRETFMRYGGIDITLGAFDKMLKDPEIPEEVRTQLKGLVTKTYGEPKLKLEPRNPIDED